MRTSAQTIYGPHTLRHFLPLLILAVGLAASPAIANEAECFQNESHLVIFQDRVDEVGAEFIIRPPARGKIACLFEPQAGDMRIGTPGDPLHYLALLGDYLVLTRSTGPDGDLVIYDLAGDTGTPVVDVPADDEVTVSEEITYWERTGGAIAETCPRYDEYMGYGFGAVTAEERVFDPATGEVTATGESRCSSTQ